MARSTSRFKSIAEALKALRDRKTTPVATKMTSSKDKDVLWVEVLNPTLALDKELVVEIMKLGQDLYKIEKNIQD